MRIIVIQETDWLRRGPHQQHHLFERLSQHGHDITVLDYPILRQHWPQESFYVHRLEYDNAARIYGNARIRLITPATLSPRILGRPTSVLSHHIALQQLIKAQEPDLIVSYALSTGLPALRLAHRHNIPYIFHVIDALHAIVPVKILQPIANAVERQILSAATEVILINEHLRDYAVRMGASPDKARVLRTGVDLQRFNAAEDGTAIRAELGLEPDDLVLFFMGWIYDFSGVIDVAESLKAAPSHVKLLVVGDGDHYERLCHMRDSGLGVRLILTGRVPYERIPALLSAADACLLPFHTVPATEHIVPIKLYEYMAAAKPVIASPLPGVQRDVGHENGILYSPAAAQIQVALEQKSQFGKLGAQARQFAETYCNWETITAEFEEVLQSHVERNQ